MKRKQLGNRPTRENPEWTQETFVTAFRRLGEFQDGLAFAPWVRGIAFNLLRNHLRKHRPVAAGNDEDPQALADARPGMESSIATQASISTSSSPAALR